MSNVWGNFKGLFVQNVPILKSMDYEKNRKEDLQNKIKQFRLEIKGMERLQNYKYELISGVVQKTHERLQQTSEFKDTKKHDIAIRSAYFYMEGLWNNTRDISKGIPESTWSENPRPIADYRYFPVHHILYINRKT